MGISCFGNSSCKCKETVKNPNSSCKCNSNKNTIIETTKVTFPNPNPNNYKIEKLILHLDKGYVLVLINYPDCTNFEGNKILVYKNVDPSTIINAKFLDPHFCNNDEHPSPIARFIPTDEGWEMALKFINS